MRTQNAARIRASKIGKPMTAAAVVAVAGIFAGAGPAIASSGPLVASATCAPDQGSLISNGGFESFDGNELPNCWTQGGQHATYVDNYAPHSGSYDLGMPGAGYGSVSQPLSGTASGQAYILSFYAKTDDLSQMHALGAQVTNVAGNSASVDVTSNLTTTYQQFSLNFTATSSAPTLTFTGQSGGGNDVFLDDVAVTADNSVPPPPQQAPPMLSFAAMPSQLGIGGDVSDFSATLTNPGSTQGGSDIANARVDFSVTPQGVGPLSPGEFDLQYLDTDSNTWKTIALVQGGAGLSGFFGPAAGFPVPAGYSSTTTLRIAANPSAPAQSVSVRADLDTTPGDTTTSVTNTGTQEISLSKPTLSVIGFPSTLTAGDPASYFSGTLVNNTGSDYGAVTPGEAGSDSVRLDFSIVSSNPSLSPSEYSLFYCSDSSGPDCPTGSFEQIPLINTAGNTLAGYYGPVGGFSLPDGYDATAYFAVVPDGSAQPGELDTTIGLDRVDASGNSGGSTDATGVATGLLTSAEETTSVFAAPSQPPAPVPSSSSPEPTPTVTTSSPAPTPTVTTSSPAPTPTTSSPTPVPTTSSASPTPTQSTPAPSPSPTPPSRRPEFPHQALLSPHPGVLTVGVTTRPLVSGAVVKIYIFLPHQGRQLLDTGLTNGNGDFHGRYTVPNGLTVRVKSVVAETDRTDSGHTSLKAIRVQG